MRKTHLNKIKPGDEIKHPTNGIGIVLERLMLRGTCTDKNNYKVRFVSTGKVCTCGESYLTKIEN